MKLESNLGTTPAENGLTAAVSHSEEDIKRAIGPYVSRKMPIISPEWRSVVAREVSQRNIVPRYWRNRLFGWAESQSAKKKAVKATYGEIWSKVDFGAFFDPAKDQMPHQWREDGYLVNSAVTQKLHLALMGRVLRHLNPASVLEVGSGWGINLAILSCVCPQARFHGVELTEQGVALTRSLAAAERLPEPILRLMDGPAADPAGYRRITVDQGSAEQLPLPDASFDVVITRLALEQMESIRERALSEMARVARSYVLMVESFREMNDEGIRRQYAIGSNYFRGRIADLPRYGLEPIFIYCDWPHKITLKPVLVLAKKVQ